MSNFFNIPVERGPDDITNIPDYFGMKIVEDKLINYECDIFAEIVDAAVMSVPQIIKLTKKYIKDGANVIDLGCMPDTEFEHLEDSVKAVKSLRFKSFC